jgi:hypothetical protein
VVSLTAVRIVPVAAWVKVTVTPGRAAPDWSTTEPWIDPVTLCAVAGPANVAMIVITAATPAKICRRLELLPSMN